jgi:hypothetical protein
MLARCVVTRRAEAGRTGSLPVTFEVNANMYRGVRALPTSRGRLRLG